MTSIGSAKLITAFLCLAISWSLSSCGTHYATVTPSAPLLDHAGDLAASANLSTTVGWAGNLSFAVLDQLSLLIEGSSYVGQKDSDRYYIYQKYQSAGGGLGTQFRYSENMQGDLYIGMAKGFSHFDGHGGMVAIVSDSGRTNLTSYFAQSAFGLRLDDDDPSDVIGYQLRLTYLVFDNYFSLLQYRKGDPDDREMFMGHSNVLASEHAVFVRTGPPSLKFTGFIAIPVTLSGKTQDLFIQGAMGIGIEFRYNMFNWTAK